MEIVKHCNDVEKALVDIRNLISLDGRINNTSYIVISDHIEMALKELRKCTKEQ